jgi:O-antigen ligase
VLLLTYSRSAWFGFLLGFLFIAIFMKRDRRVLAVSIAVPLALGAYLSFSDLVIHRLVDSERQSVSERLFEAFSYAHFSGDYYGLGRTYWMIQTMMTVIPHSPLFGFGPGTYGGGAVAALGNTEVYEALGLPFGVYGTDGYIDNNWFSLWGELGTLGLGAYGVLYFTLFAVCIRVYRESEDAEVRAIALGTAAAMLAVALNAFLATMLEARTLAPYVWIMTGAVIVLGKKEKIV